MTYFAPRYFAHSYFGGFTHEGVALPSLPTGRMLTRALRRAVTTATLRRTRTQKKGGPR